MGGVGHDDLRAHGVAAVGVVCRAPCGGCVVRDVAGGHGVAHLLYLCGCQCGVDVRLPQRAVVAVDFLPAEAVAGVCYDAAVAVAYADVVAVVEVCAGVGVDTEAPAVVVVCQACSGVGVCADRRVFRVDGEEVGRELCEGEDVAAVFRTLYLNFSVAYELLYAGEVGVERLAYLVAEAVLVCVAVVCGEALDAGREDERGAE